MKKIFGIGLLLTCLFSVVSCKKNKNVETKNAVEALKERGTFVLGLDDSFPPLGYRDKNNEIIGYDIDLAKEVAKRLGVNFKAQPIDWDAKEMELETGKIDCIWNGFTITEERKKQVDFTIEYTTSNQVVVVKKDSNITNLNDIKDKRISVQLGTVADQYVTKNYKNVKVNRLKKFLIAAEDVKNNKSDCIVMDALPAKELVKSNPELKILDGVLFQDKYGMAVKKGNQELLNTINQVLERLISEGKIEEYMIQFSE